MKLCLNTIAICFFVSLFSRSAIADGVDEPIPSFYQEPGIAQNRSSVTQLSNERVDPFTGKLQWHFVDVVLPGNGGLDIKVQRSYSSLNEVLSDFSPVGIGWTMHFGRVIRTADATICARGLSSTQNAVLELPDGSRQILYDDLDGVGMMSPSLWKATCATTPATGLIIRSPDGTRYDMTTPGVAIGSAGHTQNTWYVTRITDRNNNTLDFTYANLGVAFGVSTVTSNDGRSVTFNYTGPVLSNVTTGGSASSGGNVIWTYTLTVAGNNTTQYNLDKVTRPDGTTWLYEYNPPGTNPGLAPAGGYSLKKVTYPTGGIVNYTYSFTGMSPNTAIPTSTVVSQKQSSDGTWTFAYQPATAKIPVVNNAMTYTIDPNGNNNIFDKTTLSGPDGSTVYLHIGIESVNPGFVYSVGSLAGKYLTTTLNNVTTVSQIESYSWDLSVISNQVNQRPGSVPADNATYVPLLQKKSITRGGQIYQTTMSNWDAFLNPQTIVEQGSDTRTTNVTYYTDTAKWIIHQKKDETTSNTGTISRSFDPTNGNLLSETRYGVTTSYTYTPQGDLATKTDANGHITGYGQYSHGIPTSETPPGGAAIVRGVNDAGNITSVKDGEGVTTGYGYDGLNRLKAITKPAGNSVAVTWGTNTRVVTRGHSIETTTFDSFGRATGVVNSDDASGLTITRTFAFDSLGRRTFASYPNASLGTGYVYDVLGRLLGVYNNVDKFLTLTSESSTRNWLLNGDTVQMTNERALTYTNTYRSYGDPDHQDLMSVVAPETAANVTIARNGMGQITQVTQDGKTRTYGYDTKFFLASMTDSEVGTTTYGRDAVGNMISRTVATASATTYGYDPRNRLVQITYPAGTPSVTNTYYEDNKPKSSDNGVARHDYLYDANKNLTQETLTMTGQSFVIGYAYNANDALDVLTYGSGKTVSYSPDAFGRPTKALPYVTDVGHHPNGQISSITYANGVTSTIGLNARKWPNSISLTGPSANGLVSIANQTYTYDQVGNVYGIEDTVDGAFNRAMNYDGIDRLTVANGTWGSGTLTYDGQGNIKTQSMGSSGSYAYTYDAASNRLTSVAGPRNYTFTYDVYGNVSGNGTNTFTYNDASNMKCTNCGTGSEVAYDYDGANMRVRSTKASVSTYFIYGSSGSLLWERVPGSSLIEYIYLQGKQVAVRKHTGS